VIFREALEFILSGDNLSAVFLVRRTTRLHVREAIDLLMEVTRKLGSVIVNGYRVMEKEGRVSPQFVEAFQEYVSKHSQLPFAAEAATEQGKTGGTEQGPIGSSAPPES
jgi:hypothetical protein